MFAFLASLLFTIVFVFLILRAGSRHKYECAFHDPTCHRLAIAKIATTENYRDDRGVNEVVQIHRLWRLVDTESGKLLKTSSRPASEVPIWQKGGLVFCFRHEQPELVAIGMESLGCILTYQQGDLAEHPQLSVDSADGSLAFLDDMGVMRKIDEATRMSVPASGAALATLPAELPSSPVWSLVLLPGSRYENISGELSFNGLSGPSLGRYFRGGLIATRPPIPGNAEPRYALADDCVFVVYRESLAANANYLISKVRITNGRKDWTWVVSGALQAAFLDTNTIILVHDPGKKRVRVTALSLADGSKQWSMNA
jgi:hypothetical protein